MIEADPQTNEQPEDSAPLWRVRLEIEVAYDGEIMHGHDHESIKWFQSEILAGDRGGLILHSNEIGDEIGKVTVVKISRLIAPTPKSALPTQPKASVIP